MMPTNRFLLTLLLTLAVPSASALSFATAPETPPGLDWTTTDDVGPGIPVELGVARQVVSFVPVGDLDADGQADVILQTVDLETGAVAYAAVSGAAIEAAAGTSAAADLPDIWQTVPAPGTRIIPSGDLDADGALDHLLTQATSTAETLEQGAGGAAAQRVTATGEVVFQPLGGVGGQALFEQSLSTSLDHVRSGLDGTTGVAQERVIEQTGQVQAVAQGSLLSVKENVETTRTTLLDTVPTSTLTEVQNDVTLEFLDASGSVRATVELADPNVNVAAMLGADLDLDGVADGVVMQVEKVSPIEENPAVRPVLTAFDGATGEVSWEVTFDAVAGAPMLLPGLGDLDGDGIGELALLEQVTQAGTADPSSAVRVLSGADGAVLGTLEEAGGVAGLVPFGDLDGDDAMEALKFVDPNSGASVVAVVNAQLQQVWSLELPDGALPLNGVQDPFTQELAGFQDWTLDGVPDVAVGSGLGLDAHIDGGTVAVALHTGVDASLVWEDTFEQVLGAAVLPDVSANASQDIAVVQSLGAFDEVAPGLARADGLALTLVRGADGLGIWRLPLVPEGAIPDGTAVLADVSSVGDIDGDAIADIQVRLEFTAEAGAEIVETGATRVSTAADAVGHTYLLSGVDGDVLFSEADAAGNMSVPLQATGPVEPLAAYRGGADVQEAGKDSPLPVALVLVAALVAVALRRRR